MEDPRRSRTTCVGRCQSACRKEATMSLMRRIPFPQNLTRTVDRRPTRVAYALPTFFTAANMFFGFVALMKSFEGAMLIARGMPGAELQFVIAAQFIGL